MYPYLEIISFCSLKFISAPVAIQNVLSCAWSLIALIDSLFYSIFNLVPWSPCLAVFIFLSRFRSSLSALFCWWFLQKLRCCPWMLQGLQVIVLGHLESMAMKITLVASQQKEIAWKLLACPWLAQLCWGIAGGRRSVWNVMYRMYCNLTPSVKVSCIYVFYLLVFSKITLTSTWKEVKKIIKEDPRCIKFSSSDRVRGFCLRFPVSL